MSFFDALWSMLTSLWQWITHVLASLLTLVQVIREGFNYPLIYLGFIPSIIGSCVLAVISVAVIKLIIGR